MRRKIGSIVVVGLLLAAICAFEQWYVAHTTEDTLAAVSEIASLIRAGELGAAHEKTHALDRAWDKQAAWLEMLVDHGSTDDVRFALSRLIAALEGGDQAAALIYAGELEGGVEHVCERQALSPENLL